MSESKPTYGAETSESIEPFRHHAKQFIPLNAETIRYIFPVLTKSEWCILTFLIYKIEAFGKESDAIPYTQFALYTPVHSKEAISSALNGLVSLGLVNRHRKLRTDVMNYTLNINAKIYTITEGKRLTSVRFANGVVRFPKFGNRTDQ